VAASEDAAFERDAPAVSRAVMFYPGRDRVAIHTAQITTSNTAHDPLCRGGHTWFRGCTQSIRPLASNECSERTCTVFHLPEFIYCPNRQHLPFKDVSSPILTALIQVAIWVGMAYFWLGKNQEEWVGAD
jgi:hypothetical protein